MDLEGKWITLKDGRRIKLKPKTVEPKKINDYMNEKIRGKGTGDYGYHYGDLGKGTDTYFFGIDSSRRSTGHYGTGTYFFGENGKDNSYNPMKEERPMHKVDFSEYNLFKPKNETDAFLLHRGLRAVNYFRDNSLQSYYEEMKTMMTKYGIKESDISNAYNKAKKIYFSDKYQRANYDANLDSISTVFMKELGFNGVDVRNLEQYDNSSYGSVIYDLNKKKK